MKTIKKILQIILMVFLILWKPFAIIYLVFSVLMLLMGCVEEPAEDIKPLKLCVYKINPVQTDPSCIPHCIPPLTWVACIEPFEYYKYDNSNYEISECDLCNN